MSGVAWSPGLASATPDIRGPVATLTVIVFSPQVTFLRPRSAMQHSRCPVLAECGESARQAASRDTYPVLERAGHAFGSTPAP